MIKAILFFMVLALVVTITPVYLLLYTSMPFTFMASEFQKRGVQMTGVSGSLDSGLRIQQMTVNNDELELDMSGLNISYSGIGELISNQQIVFNDISLAKLHIKLKKKPSLSAGGGTSGESSSGASSGSSSSGASKGIPLKLFRIVMVDIKNVEISYPGAKEPFKLKSALVSNMDFRFAERKFVIQLINIVSNKYRFKVKNFSADASESGKYSINLGEGLKAKLSASAMDSLKQDFEVEVKGFYSQDQMAAGGNKLHAKFGGGVAELNWSGETDTVEFKTNSFSPGDYFTGAWPLANLNVVGVARGFMPAIAGGLQLKGSFSYQDVPFTVAEEGSVLRVFPKIGMTKIIGRANKAGTDYELVFDNSKALLAAENSAGVEAEIGATQQVLALRSSTSSDSEQSLASFLFSTSPDKLSAPQRQLFDIELAYFNSGSSAGEAVPINGQMQANQLNSQEPASVQRQPAAQTAPITQVAPNTQVAPTTNAASTTQAAPTTQATPATQSSPDSRVATNPDIPAQTPSAAPTQTANQNQGIQAVQNRQPASRTPQSVTPTKRVKSSQFRRKPKDNRPLGARPVPATESDRPRELANFPMPGVPQ